MRRRLFTSVFMEMKADARLNLHLEKGVASSTRTSALRLPAKLRAPLFINFITFSVLFSPPCCCGEFDYRGVQGEEMQIRL